MRTQLSIALLCLSVCASQAAEYRFKPLPDTKTGEIQIKLASGTSKQFRLPAWSPGDYELFNYGKNVLTIKFLRDGKEVAGLQGSDPNLWTIEGGADEVVYTVKPSRGNFTVNLRVTPEESFVSPSAVFGWFDGHAKEKHLLRLPVDKGFAVECPLAKGTRSPEGEARYVADNLDELLDSPFVISKKLLVQNFDVMGKKHAIAAFNNSAGVDLESYAKNGRAVAEQAYRLFGELPYDRYIFFLDFGGGGGGLEHMNSTRIGAYSKNGSGAAGIMFHEYFHAFNVKRIRAKALGPFDYTKPAMTGTIWWLEGVTDYYADVLQARAGIISRDQFLNEMLGTLRSLGNNSASEKVSADEVSRRVWEVRGSFGFQGLSYYEKGKGIGFILDLAIRAKSKNKYSLDDVIRQLYEECKGGKPGYEDARIRELCVKYGGPELGAIYDQCAMKAQHLPASEVLSMAGFAVTDRGIVDDSSKAGALGPTYPFDLRGKNVFNP